MIGGGWPRRGLTVVDWQKEEPPSKAAPLRVAAQCVFLGPHWTGHTHSVTQNFAQRQAEDVHRETILQVTPPEKAEIGGPLSTNAHARSLDAEA
jgi:hypothetical protein